MRTNLVLQSANVNIFELALDSVELAAIASELAEAPGSPTGVYTSDQGLTAESTMDDEIRQTHEVQASHAVRVAVRKAIDSCQSDLERTYGQLERPRRLGYLRYKAGHHFLAHRDVLIMPDGHLNPTSRRKASGVRP